MTDTRPDLAVLHTPAQATACHHLAEALSLPLLDRPGATPFVLTYTDRGLALQQTGAGAPGPVLVDFVGGAARHRRQQGGGELVVRAVTGRKQRCPQVVDATAGLGRDSFVLASRGCSVTLCERSGVIAALLQDGLQRAQNCADAAIELIAQRMALVTAQAGDYLRALPAEQAPDVVLIDPMFPASGKSAQAKKEMRAFQQVVGPDRDSAELLTTALEVARHRVVVKRPRKAPALAGRAPGFALNGKAIRFDVYPIRAFEAS